MNFRNQPFTMGLVPEEAIKKNLPGARAMSRAHNLLHQAEETNALAAGQDMSRTAYVCSLLDEAEALCAKERDELLKSPAGKGLMRIAEDPDVAQAIERSMKKGKATRSKTKKATRERTPRVKTPVQRRS